MDFDLVLSWGLLILRKLNNNRLIFQENISLILHQKCQQNQNNGGKDSVSMCKLVPDVDASWLSKMRILSCLSFNKSMGLNLFNGKALELLLAAICHSEPKWDKWGEAQQHHSFVHQGELRVKVNMKGKVRHKRQRPLFINFTGSSTAVCKVILKLPLSRTSSTQQLMKINTAVKH